MEGLGARLTHGFADEWALRNFTQRNAGLELATLPFTGADSAAAHAKG